MNDERKHLTGLEFEKLMVATKGIRNEARDHCLILLMFRHGLRVSEACGLTLAQVDTESRVLHVSRLKGGLSTTHPLKVEELRAVKAWLIERGKMKLETTAFFGSERRTQLCRGTARAVIRKYGELAGLTLPVQGKNDEKGDRQPSTGAVFVIPIYNI